MPHDSGSPTLRLTVREGEVLRMVGDGLSSKQIAARLGIAPKTVETYIEHVRLKVGATNRAHMIALAVAERLFIVGDGGAE